MVGVPLQVLLAAVGAGPAQIGLCPFEDGRGGSGVASSLGGRGGRHWSHWSTLLLLLLSRCRLTGDHVVPVVVGVPRVVHLAALLALELIICGGGSWNGLCCFLLLLWLLLGNLLNLEENRVPLKSSTQQNL